MSNHTINIVPFDKIGFEKETETNIEILDWNKTIENAIEDENDELLPVEISLISTAVIFIAIIAISWIPIMWIFCKWGKKFYKTSEKETQTYPEGEDRNCSYQPYTIDDEMISSGLDNQGFVDIDLGIFQGTFKENEAQNQVQDLPSTSSGIYHKTNTELILNVSDLMKNASTTSRRGAKKEHAKRMPFFRHVTNFIKNVVCKTRPEERISTTRESSCHTEASDLDIRCVSLRKSNHVDNNRKYQEVDLFPAVENKNRGMFLNKNMRMRLQSFVQRESKPAEILKRSLSLPIRFKKCRRKFQNDLIPLRAKIQKPEESVGDDEASAVCCAVILKNLKSQGCLTEAEIGLNPIKITEISRDKIGPNNEIEEFSFRVEIPKQFSNHLNRKSRNEKWEVANQHGGNVLVLRKKTMENGGDDPNVIFLFEKFSRSELTGTIEKIIEKEITSDEAEEIKNRDVANERIIFKDDETHPVCNVCLIVENLEHHNDFLPHAEKQKDYDISKDKENYMKAVLVSENQKEVEEVEECNKEIESVEIATIEVSNNEMLQHTNAIVSLPD